MMKQVFHPYQEWEGYLAGMYEPCKENRQARVSDARKLLSDPEKLRENMVHVTDEWPNETEQVLTDASISHRAWLGQSACMLFCGAREDETREAWGLLTEGQRRIANKQADYADRRWRELYERASGVFQLSFYDLVGDVL